MLALFAPSQFVICPRYGRNMTWRLQPHQCPNLIKTNWFRFSATIVGRAHKFSFTLWPRNAQTANLTTLAKQETEQVAMAAPHMVKAIHSLGLGFHCISAMACSSNSALPHINISGGPRSIVVLLWLGFRRVCCIIVFCLSSLYRFLLSKISARLAMIYFHVDSLFSLLTILLIYLSSFSIAF